MLSRIGARRRRRQIGMRIDRRGGRADLEMQLRLGDIAGLADIADDLTARHDIATRDDQPVGMGIGGGVTAGMFHQHQIAVILEFIAGIGDGA